MIAMLIVVVVVVAAMVVAKEDDDDGGGKENDDVDRGCGSRSLSLFSPTVSLSLSRPLSLPSHSCCPPPPPPQTD